MARYEVSVAALVPTRSTMNFSHLPLCARCTVTLPTVPEKVAVVVGVGILHARQIFMSSGARWHSAASIAHESLAGWVRVPGSVLPGSVYVQLISSF